MDPNDKSGKPEREGKERSIPLKWIFLAVLAFVIFYHLTLWMKFR